MQEIGFVVFPEFQVMGFTAITAFEVANLIAGDPFYEVTLLSEHGGPVRSSAGFNVETEAFGARSFDTLFIGAGHELHPASPKLTGFIRRAMTESQRIAAPCIGAFSLAEAGLLDGRRVSTHWQFAAELQARFPKLKVDQDRIYIVDGPIWTSAGMTATIDLALAMIEHDLGVEVARSVARKLVVYHRRPGGQSQFSALLELEPRSDRVRRALVYAKEHLRNPLTVEELAEAVRVSPRQFSRLFRDETGQSPAKAVERLRLEAAKAMLEEGRHSLDVVARDTGFADRDRMRRAFLRAFGHPPQSLRRSLRLIEGPESSVA